MAADSSPDNRNGLVAHWRMDEGAGLAIADSSGNEHHGALRYTAWRKEGPATALWFDGISSRAVVDDHPQLAIAGDITVCAFIFKERPNRGERWDVVVAKPPGLQDYELLTSMARSDEMAFYSHGCRPIEGYGGVPVAHSAWHHVAVTRAGSDVRFFLDGLQTSAATMDGPFPQSPGDLIIGHDGVDGKGHGLRGLMRELRLYDRALAADDILAVFESTKA